MDKAEDPSLDFLKKYAELRTVMDALDIFAVKYSLAPTTNRERIKKINAVVKDLMPLVKKYGGSPSRSSTESGCRPPLCECNGVCVPYDCP